jgi:magnesium and cobalt transporter
MSDIPSRSGAADEKPRLGFKGLMRLFRRKASSENALRDAIEELIEESEAGDDGEAPLDSNESSLLLNVLKLGDLTAYDVMVPRADIKAAAETIDLKGLIQMVREFGHSRLPIYREDLDDIVGIVHAKDVLTFFPDPEKFQLKKILREPMFISPSIPVLDLLLQMRHGRAHMALVVDEYGGIDGLVTIEDLVEEIIGEIEDEHDVVKGPHLVSRPGRHLARRCAHHHRGLRGKGRPGADRGRARGRYRHAGRAGHVPDRPRAPARRTGDAFLRHRL